MHTDYPNECMLLFIVTECYNCLMRTQHFTKQRHFMFYIVQTTYGTYAAQALENSYQVHPRVDKKHDSQKGHINVHLMRLKGSPNTVIHQDKKIERETARCDCTEGISYVHD